MSVSTTKNYRETIEKRIKDAPSFAIGLLEDAISLIASGEPDVSRLLLRNLVNATIGFEALSDKLAKPSKSLHRMLSAKGNPTMDNLSAIINILRQHLEIESLRVSCSSAENIEETESADLEDASPEAQLQTV